MWRSSREPTAREISQKLKDLTSSQMVRTSEGLVVSNAELFGYPKDILKIIDKIFVYSFWHSPTSSVIRDVKASFISDQLLRGAISKEKYNADMIAEAVFTLWQAKGLLELRMRGSDSAVLSEKGADILKDAYGRLPKWYLTLKDMFESPLSKMAWIVGVVSGLIAIYQWLLPFINSWLP